MIGGCSGAVVTQPVIQKAETATAAHAAKELLVTAFPKNLTTAGHTIVLPRYQPVTKVSFAAQHRRLRKQGPAWAL